MRGANVWFGVFVGLAALSAPAVATDVNLAATLVNSCVLTLNSVGVMTPASSGTVISSEESGGSAAALSRWL